MSTATVLLIAIPLMVVLALAIAFTSARRRDSAGLGHLSRETASRDRAVSTDLGEPALTGAAIEKAAVLERTSSGADLAVREAAPPPEPWMAPDPEVVGVNRRQFLNRSSTTLMAVGLGTFGLACIAFLWPKTKGGFGSSVSLGSIGDVEAALDAGTGTGAPGFAYYADAQTYITRFPSDAISAAEAAGYDPSLLPGMEAGYIASWKTCPHLGCTVPACATSQWFECPCHGSKYTRVGEKTPFGPAPRGLDHFPIVIDGGDFVVDTGGVKLGMPRGTNTTSQGAEGPFCTDAGGEH
jgi:cytochrome b6-f complex iron-sulfur subunit